MKSVNWDSASIIIFISAMITILLVKGCESFNYSECTSKNRANCEGILR